MVPDLRVRVRDLKHIALRGIDDRRPAAGAHARQLGIIVQVHMPVYEPLRLVFVHQIVEAFKPLVGAVCTIIQARCRRMGQQQIDASHLMSPARELVRTAAHFPFRIQALPHINAVVHTDAAAGLIFAVAAVVVAVNIQNRGCCKVCKVFQILLRQVSTGKDQVDPLQMFPGTVIPQRFRGHIRNCKNFHFRFAPFSLGRGPLILQILSEY